MTFGNIYYYYCMYEKITQLQVGYNYKLWLSKIDTITICHPRAVALASCILVEVSWQFSCHPFADTENHLKIQEFKQTTSPEPIAKEASTTKAIIVNQEKQQLTYSENLIKNNAIAPTENKADKRWLVK